VFRNFIAICHHCDIQCMIHGVAFLMPLSYIIFRGEFLFFFMKVLTDNQLEKLVLHSF
jgi:hypothetical protein